LCFGFYPGEAAADDAAAFLMQYILLSYAAVNYKHGHIVQLSDPPTLYTNEKRILLHVI